MRGVNPPSAGISLNPPSLQGGFHCAAKLNTLNAHPQYGGGGRPSPPVKSTPPSEYRLKLAKY